jgi:hypothetical protein
MSGCDIPAPKKATRKDCKVTNQEIADAITRTHGIIATAAELLCREKSEKTGRKISITRQSISERIHNNEKLKQAHDEAADAMLDFAEDKLFQKIIAGDIGAIIFYLKCKGKRRGYIERSAVEVSGENGMPITPPSFVVNFVKPDKAKALEEEAAESTTAE